MKNFSLKALGAFIFAAGLVVAGVAAPASAASLVSPTVTATSSVTTGAVTVPLTIDATTVTAGATRFVITLPTGWTTTLIGSPQCTGVTITGMTITGNGCGVSGSVITLYSSAGAVAANTAIQVVIAPNKLTAAAARDFTISTRDNSGELDTGVATLASGVTPPATPEATLTLGASTGQLVAGSSVAVVASGLQATAPYEVVVRSTPQTIGTGNAVSGAVNTSVTLPSGLEAGWHSLTFTSTAADGSALSSVAYFKVSASGTLLATSTTIPPELANTGVDSTTAILLLAGGLSLALVGAEMFMIARRKRSN